MLTHSCLLLLLITAVRPVHSGVERRFTEYTAQCGQSQVRYQAYRPPNPAAPVVVWMHGRGEAGSNNRDQLVWLELVLGTSQHTSEFPAWIVAVQVPRSCSCWSQGDHEGLDGLDRLDAALRDLRRRHPEVLSKTLLAGISQGGSGCWSAIQRWPNRFTAALVLGSSELPRCASDQLSNQPVWAFQSSADGPAAWQNLRQFADDVNQHGGAMRTTRVVSATHDCWTAAFRQHKAMEWLLRQSQDRADTPHRFRLSSTLTLLTLAVVIIIRLRRRPRTCQPKSP